MKKNRKLIREDEMGGGQEWGKWNGNRREAIIGRGVVGDGVKLL